MAQLVPILRMPTVDVDVGLSCVDHVHLERFVPPELLVHRAYARSATSAYVILYANIKIQNNKREIIVSIATAFEVDFVS